MSNRQGRLYVISAPSGAGKGTLIKSIVSMRSDIKLSVSTTTRKPRRGEINGVDYDFVSHDEFTSMIDNNEFLEYANYIGEYYGTPIKTINEYVEKGVDIILEIEVKGAKQVMEQKPDATTIFIVPPDMEELERRLRKRGTDTEQQLKARLERARVEMDEKVHYDHVVVNDEIQRAVQEINQIIDNY